MAHRYAEALKDQGQVFLPINNALSPVGHVHWYLEQLGQGIQHVASRVQSLPDYVQRANDYRQITGEGLTFLNIPRTYYGLLDKASFTTGGDQGEFLDHSPPKKSKKEKERERQQLGGVGVGGVGLGPAAGLGDSGGGGGGGGGDGGDGDGGGALSAAEADAALTALADAGLVDDMGAVSLGVTDQAVMEAIEQVDLGKSFSAAAARKKKRVVCKCVKRSIYGNLWKLLGDQVRPSVRPSFRRFFFCGPMHCIALHYITLQYDTIQYSCLPTRCFFLFLFRHIFVFTLPSLPWPLPLRPPPSNRRSPRRHT